MVFEWFLIVGSASTIRGWLCRCTRTQGPKNPWQFKRFARGWFSKFMIFTPTWRNDPNFDQQIFQRFCVVQTPTRELSSFWRGKQQKSQNSKILWPLHCQVNWSLVLYISFVWTKMALARRISSQHMAPWCGSRDLIKSTTRKGLRLSYCCVFMNRYLCIHPSTFNLWYVSISVLRYSMCNYIYLDVNMFKVLLD